MTLDLENFHCLGDTSVDDFLKHYWQKKPLLIRNAFPGIQSPLTAEELAGLACEEDVIDFQQLQQAMTTNDKQVLLTLFNVGAVISQE